MGISPSRGVHTVCTDLYLPIYRIYLPMFQRPVPTHLGNAPCPQCTMHNILPEQNMTAVLAHKCQALSVCAVDDTLVRAVCSPIFYLFGCQLHSVSMESLSLQDSSLPHFCTCVSLHASLQHADPQPLPTSFSPHPPIHS